MVQSLRMSLVNMQRCEILLYVEHDRTFWFNWISKLMHLVAQYIMGEFTKRYNIVPVISCKIYTYTPIRKSSFIVFKSPIAFKKRGKEAYDKYKRMTVIAFVIRYHSCNNQAPQSLNLVNMRKFRQHTFIIKRVVMRSSICMSLFFK